MHLPEDLSQKVEEVAAARHLTPEQVAIEVIELHLHPTVADDPLEAFIGSGHSGHGNLATHHRKIIAQAFTNKTARDI